MMNNAVSRRTNDTTKINGRIMPGPVSDDLSIHGDPDIFVHYILVLTIYEIV